MPPDGLMSCQPQTERCNCCGPGADKSVISLHIEPHHGAISLDRSIQVGRKKVVVGGQCVKNAGRVLDFTKPKTMGTKAG